MYTYKQLGDSDTPVLKELLAVFGNAFEDQKSYGIPPSDEYLKSFLSKNHVIALAAINDSGAAVGGLVAYILEKFEQERKEIYIYDLAVLEAHRRKGIATALIKALTGIARDQGAYVIFVQADRGDTPAIRLYESLGTREDVHHFDIPVT